MSRPGRRTLVLAVLALAAVVAVRPPAAPPLYDGLGFPDEPYRWVSAPAGSGTTPAATSLDVTVDLAAASGAIGKTAEQGPQLAISIAAGSLAVPAGAKTVSVRATPQAGPPPPQSGTLVSNLYGWTATADVTGEVGFAAGKTAVVNLRADVATTQAVVLESWDGTTWRQLPTRQVGVDIYAARIRDLLPIALVKLDVGVQPTVSAESDAGGAGGSVAPTAAPGSAGAVGGSGATPQQVASGGPGFGLWIGLGVVLLMLAFGLVLARRRATAPPADDADAAGTT
jgi:hypothetical protein